MLIPEVRSKQVTSLPKHVCVEVTWQPQNKRWAAPHVMHRSPLQDGLLQKRIHWKHLQRANPDASVFKVAQGASSVDFGCQRMSPHGFRKQCCERRCRTLLAACLYCNVHSDIHQHWLCIFHARVGGIQNATPAVGILIFKEVSSPGEYFVPLLICSQHSCFPSVAHLHMDAQWSTSSIPHNVKGTLVHLSSARSSARSSPVL
jgi:hypothetical protein